MCCTFLLGSCNLKSWKSATWPAFWYKLEKQFFVKFFPKFVSFLRFFSFLAAKNILHNKIYIFTYKKLIALLAGPIKGTISCLINLLDKMQPSIWVAFRLASLVGIQTQIPYSEQFSKHNTSRMFGWILNCSRPYSVWGTPSKWHLCHKKLRKLLYFL